MGGGGRRLPSGSGAACPAPDGRAAGPCATGGWRAGCRLRQGGPRCVRGPGRLATASRVTGLPRHAAAHPRPGRRPPQGVHGPATTCRRTPGPGRRPPQAASRLAAPPHTAGQVARPPQAASQACHDTPPHTTGQVARPPQAASRAATAAAHRGPGRQPPQAASRACHDAPPHTAGQVAWRRRGALPGLTRRSSSVAAARSEANRPRSDASHGSRRDIITTVTATEATAHPANASHEPRTVPSKASWPNGSGSATSSRS